MYMYRYDPPQAKIFLNNIYYVYMYVYMFNIKCAYMYVHHYIQVHAPIAMGPCRYSNCSLAHGPAGALCEVSGTFVLTLNMQK